MLEEFGGHPPCETQAVPAAEKPPLAAVTMQPIDRLPRAAQPTATTILAIREHWRRRQSWHRAEKSLTQSAKNLCRRLAMDGDKTEADLIYKAALGDGDHLMAAVALVSIMPIVDARDGIEKHRKQVEKRLSALAKELPVAPWIASIRGVGVLSLAAIVGETGDLCSYANPGKVWKRLGLAVMPDGKAQRRVTGDAAIAHGYSPARRSVVWSIGVSMIKARGTYRPLYDDRKAYEIARNPEIRPIVAHARAQRYMEKRFLRDLWVAWRQAAPARPRLQPNDRMPEQLA